METIGFGHNSQANVFVTEEGGTRTTTNLKLGLFMSYLKEKGLGMPWKEMTLAQKTTASFLALSFNFILFGYFLKAIFSSRENR